MREHAVLLRVLDQHIIHARLPALACGLERSRHAGVEAVADGYLGKGLWRPATGGFELRQLGVRPLYLKHAWEALLAEGRGARPTSST